MSRERRKPDIELIRVTAREATNSMLETMGFDLEHPHNIQKDLHHLRRSREICDLIQNKLIAVIIGILITSTVGAAWVGFSTALEIEHKIEKK